MNRNRLKAAHQAARYSKVEHVRRLVQPELPDGVMVDFNLRDFHDKYVPVRAAHDMDGYPISTLAEYHILWTRFLNMPASTLAAGVIEAFKQQGVQKKA